MKIRYLILLILSISSLNANLTIQPNLDKFRSFTSLAAWSLVSNAAKIFLRSSYNNDNPYKTTPCAVRYGTNLCNEENNVISKRIVKSKASLEKFLGTSIKDENFPRIAICASGGGYRAMISTLGSLIGMNEIGLLDSVIYSSALSGSTWAFGSWITLNYELNKLKEHLSNNISTNPKIGKNGILPAVKEFDQIKMIVNNITTEYLFNQPLEFVDIYGILLANNLFSPMQNRQNLRLSNQQKVVENGDHIFPIYTAIEPTTLDFHYNWYEFTPYEVGSHFHNCFVPTWGFGREFKNGQAVPYSTGMSKEFGPEFHLGYMLGIFGSAFEINIEELVRMFDSQNLNYLEKFAINTILQKYLSPIEDKRLFPAKTFNFTYGLSNCPNKTQQDLILMDAGIDFNLPFPPLLKKERKVDIILVIDASASLAGAPELQKAENYAKNNNLKFPKIDYTNIDKKSISIFIDEKDKETPAIIYLPLVRDVNLAGLNQNALIKNFDPCDCITNSYCSTFNCAYSKDQFNQLCELTRFNTAQNKNKLKEAVLKKIKINSEH